MTREKPFLGRLGKFGSKAFISLTSLKQEIESVGADRLEKLARRLHLVRRAEFQDVQAELKQIRKNQDDILIRLAAMEGHKKSLRGASAKGATRRKAAGESSVPRRK